MLQLTLPMPLLQHKLRLLRLQRQQQRFLEQQMQRLLLHLLKLPLLPLQHKQ